MSNFDSRVEKREKIKGTSTVAVMHNDKILMGQRRDNQKWTFPGGGLNDGESPEAGALRELYEEAGIVADKLDHLTSKVIEGRTGNQIEVHAFKFSPIEPPHANSFNDPDNEVAKWQWVDTLGGLSLDILNNLQSPKNLLLEQLGLSGSSASFDDTVEKKLNKLKGSK